MSEGNAIPATLPPAGNPRGETAPLPAAFAASLVSPYTVTPSDGSVLRLTECKLNGENYLAWSRLMRMALRAKNKVCFIDGTLPEPADGDPSKPLWVMANSLVVTWMINSLEKELQPSIACIENALILWEDLRQRFAQGNETRIYQLKFSRIAGQQDGTPLNSELEADLHMEEEEIMGQQNEKAHSPAHDGNTGEPAGSPIQLDDNPIDYGFPGRASPNPISSRHDSSRIRSDDLLEETVISPEISDSISGDIPILRRSDRAQRPHSFLKDYVCHTAMANSLPVCPNSSGTPYPFHNYLSYTGATDKYISFLAALDSDVEPRSYKKAARDSRWRAAMAEELRALELNGTWTVSALPSRKKLVDCKWVYKIKWHADGSVERYKARLVAKGFTQVEGVDFGETFAPVAKLVTVRCFLAVAVMKKWEIHHMDVHNAFLHGDLHEEVYMSLPPGLSSTWPGQFGADHSLFTYSKGTIFIAVVVYVDDLLVAGNSPIHCTSFKKYLSSCFRIKDLGTLRYFLGIEVSHMDLGLFLCQRKYAIDILSECGMLDSRPSEAPMEQNHRLSSDSGALLGDPGQYRRLVGRLLYLTITGSELTYSV
ncbi:hypothetical protein CRG98_008657 [Punica granatum]|uniref:Reverse transcriptase Ty1/copia-type domain-containing protein n=1 Tax=Punica granatum TaxID=22663 RepID=A0A2I0KQZ9_PUNGR|nr:hypothetical protein CRG98_008657 [Punica granatum]